jgi:hypothetical protein
VRRALAALAAVLAGGAIASATPASADPGTVLSGSGYFEIIDLRTNGEVWAWRNVNGLNPNTYPSGPRTIGVGWNYYQPWRLKFADLNNDQRAEIIAIDLNGDVRAFRNVNGLNPNTYPEPAKVVGVGWSAPWRVFFAEIVA